MLPAMTLPLPLQFFFVHLAGWVNRQQDAVIDYLREESRAPRRHTSIRWRSAGRLGRPAMPAFRVATGVVDGEDDEVISADAVDHSVGELANRSAA